jgi:hypothetical protein
LLFRPWIVNEIHEEKRKQQILEILKNLVA